MSIADKIILDWLPHYVHNFNSRQISGIHYMLDQIYCHRKDGLHVMSIPPGIGKTTMIQGMIAYNLTEPAPISMVIVTDRLYRLSDYVTQDDLREKAESIPYCNARGKFATRYDKNIINLSEMPSVNMADVIKTPIVMLSLQKFNSLGSRARSDLYTYGTGNSRRKRDMIVIDEAIISHDTVTIDNTMLHGIKGTLLDVIDDPQDRDAIDIYDQFLSWFLGREEAMEKGMETTMTMTIPWICDRTTIADPQNINGQSNPDQERFFAIIHRYKTKLLARNAQFMRQLSAIQNMLRPESINIYCCNAGGASKGRGYRYILSNIDYLDNLPRDLPVYILDGTAELDITYEDSRFELISGSMYGRDLSNVSVYLYDARTNITRVRDPKYAKALYTAIRDTIGQYYLTTNDGWSCHMPSPEDWQSNALITHYKDTEKIAKEVFDKAATGTLGDLTGKNDWQSKTILVKTGILRVPNVLSFMDLMHSRPELWQRYLEYDMDNIVHRRAVSDRLNRISTGKCLDIDMDIMAGISDLVVSRWMVDLVQELYRTHIRDYGYDGPIDMFVICHPDMHNNDIYAQFYNNMAQYYTGNGANINHCGQISLLVSQANRKAKDGSGELATFGKVLRALGSMPDGSYYTIDDLAQTAGISASRIRAEKSRNRDFRKFLAAMEVNQKAGRRQLYKVDHQTMFT